MDHSRFEDMMRPKHRGAWGTYCLFLLALALGPWLSACSRRRGGGEGDFLVLSASLAEGGTHPINAPIELRFSKEVDLATVSFSTVSIVPIPPAASGAPAPGPVRGSFFLEPGSEGRMLVFQPLCPSDGTKLDGGFLPGNEFGPVLYALSLPAGDEAPSVRAVDGSALAAPFVLSFRTPTPPASPFRDPEPSGPPAVAEAGLLPRDLGLNLLIRPNPPLLLRLDQPVRAETVGPRTLRMEFTHPETGLPAPIPAKVFLAANCTESQEAVLGLLPLGILPPGQEVRFLLSQELEGLGEGDRGAADVLFHVARVSPAGGPPQRDAILEGFDTAERMDPNPPIPRPLAGWEGGLLQAAPLFPGALNGIDVEIGPLTPNGPNVLFSTDGAALRDQNGAPVFFPGGVIEVRRFTVRSPQPGRTSTFAAIGSNPLVIRCSEGLVVEPGAAISVSGQKAPNVGGLQTANLPSPGGEGRCGGGNGGAGSPLTTQSSPKGADGEGAFHAPNGGGGGGHTGYQSGVTGSRPGGGGGGNWERWERGSTGSFVTYCYSILPCAVPGCPYPLAGCAPPGCDGVDPNPATWGEQGATGVATALDAILGTSPPVGGRAGPAVFLDGDPGNDYFGRKPVADRVAAGELGRIQGGQGGGGGGDNIPGPDFPNPAFPKDRRGAGGGGGAGALWIQSFGELRVDGVLSADGGEGGLGEELTFGTAVGGGGGGGAGGMILLESATRVRIGWNASIAARGGNRGYGGDTIPNPPANCSFGGNECRNNCTASRGGAGGKGIVQIHCPFVDSPPVSCGGDLRPSVEPGALLVETDSSGSVAEILCEGDPLLGARFDPDPHVLVPGFGLRSASLSRWFYLGWAEISATPRFEFGGIDSKGRIDPKFSLALAAGEGGEVRDLGTVVVLRDPPLADLIRSEPLVLVEDGFQPDEGAPELRIVAAAVAGDEVSIALDPPTRGIVESIGSWTVFRRYFSAAVDGEPPPFPEGLEIRLLFEGAEESAPGSMEPAPGSVKGPTAEISTLKGLKLLRFRALFDRNAGGLPASLSIPRPELAHLKIPISF